MESPWLDFDAACGYLRFSRDQQTGCPGDGLRRLPELDQLTLRGHEVLTVIAHGPGDQVI